MRIVAAVLMAMTMPAFAGVTVKDAWVRGTVPGQDTTGAFMTVTSSEDAKLVEASSPVAKKTSQGRAARRSTGG